MASCILFSGTGRLLVGRRATHSSRSRAPTWLGLLAAIRLLSLLAPLVVVVLDANLVAARRREHAGYWEPPRRHRGGRANKPYAFEGSFFMGVDELDYSRDPTFVDPTIYDQGDCKSGWAYALSGQLEALENYERRGADKFRGKPIPTIQPKSKRQLLNCHIFSYEDGFSLQGEGYLERVALAFEEELPTMDRSCTTGECHAKNHCSEGRHSFRVLSNDTFEGNLTGFFAQSIELLLREWGPLAWFTNWDYNFDGKELIDCAESRKFPTNQFHAVLLVGYGFGYKRNERVRYLKFKNSMGTEWGDNGYGYVRQGEPSEPGCSNMRGYIVSIQPQSCR